MPLSVNGANGITFSDGSIQNTGAVGFGFKNRIINGAMIINQRSYNGSPSNGNYTLDRYFYNANASRVTISQSSDAPTGFNKSLLVTSSAASTIGTNDYTNLCQVIEGYNIADLMWGTSSASAVTLSFYVKSSITGTFGGAIRNSAGGAGYWGYTFTYSISQANTWTRISVTIPGPTNTSYTWGSTNDSGIWVWWDFGTGSTYTAAAGTWVNVNTVGADGTTKLVNTNGATWQLTGVQLEKGSTATAFDPRPYSYELQLCQRYYSQLVGNYTPDFIIPNSSYVNYFTHCWQFPQTMRAAPTVSQISGTTVTMDQFGIGPATVSSNQVGSVNQYYVRLTVLTSSPSSAAPGTAISATGTFWQASAEF